MEFNYYDMDDRNLDMNYRWVQPPLPAYFVVTQDKYGNDNITPVTLGNLNSANMPREDCSAEFYFSFALGITHIQDEDNELEARHGYHNLMERPECVISYIGMDQKDQSWLAGLPVPRGISEFDVAGLTRLPSNKISPPGVAECAVNMESTVETSLQLGKYYRLFICKIVAVHVNEELDRLDRQDPGRMGVAAIDPLYEMDIARNSDGNIRLIYGRLDREDLLWTSGDVGGSPDWIGSFESWMDAEQHRGKVSEAEKNRILDLNRTWQKNRDPATNGKTRMELTRMLRKITGDPHSIGS